MISQLSSHSSRLRNLAPRSAYRELIKLLRQQYRRASVDELPHELRLFFAVDIFDSEVCNGGLLQFFTNPCGKDYHFVIEGLQKAGMVRHRHILERWLQMLPPGINPTAANEVGRTLFSMPEYIEASRRLNEEYFQIREEFYSKMVVWALD